MHIVFLTRKFPPQKGGMETFSWQLTQQFPKKKSVIHYGKRQIDVIWVAPLLLFRALLLRKRASLFHLGDLVLSPIAPFLKWFTKKPIIVTVHGLELTYAKGGALYHWLINSSLSSIDHFVAVSSYTAELLKKRGVPEAKISVISHGVVPPKTFDHHNARKQIFQVIQKEDSQQLLMLTVGRLVPRKGVAWFVEQVLPHILNMNPLYLIISDGSDRKHIQQLVTQKNLQQHVHLLGRINDILLEQLYAGSDLFIMPNLPLAGDAEGFGFVAIEAAAAGLPVMASNIEGIPSAIHHQKNGLLLPSGNARAYIQAIHSFADEKKRIVFGKQAQEYTLQHFQWKQVVEQYQTLFTQITL